MAEKLGLCHADGKEHTLVVIASHDCDLTQTPTIEPAIEVIVGRIVDELNGNYCYSKNPRKLHIIFDGAPSIIAEFEASKKIPIPKETLQETTPRQDLQLSPTSLNTLQFWLASRYRRSAFPEEFERRLGSKEVKLAEKIYNIMKPAGENVSGIFFDVDDGAEINRDGPDDTYTLSIMIIYPAEPEPLEAEKVAATAAQEIQKAFEEKLFKPQGKWQHIELSSCDAISEEAISYGVFKQLKRWRFEHMSLAGQPQQATLPE
ncbi:hypothetical protein OIK44_11565 [Janthinobacterium sp. hw3]|uniref:Uncharacterized protein n=1 Tax=Janthinobacterium fluminis TaxID=2987524 RepID=A0ABT5K0H3_9BURK|nr:hypothetical protein [Janthinobacterium fluminis]